MPDAEPFVVGAVLISAAEIAIRVHALAAEIDAAYAATERPLVLLCVLKGSLFFTADLSRALTLAVELDCIAVRSYGESAVSGGQVELVKDVGMSLRDRDVLIVEDIVDTGSTTAFLFEHCAQHQPRTLRLVALLNKEGRRTQQVQADFVGFSIPDRFVVGYGLDLAEQYRQLPDVRLVRGL